MVAQKTKTEKQVIYDVAGEWYETLDDQTRMDILLDFYSTYPKVLQSLRNPDIDPQFKKELFCSILSSASVTRTATKLDGTLRLNENGGCDRDANVRHRKSNIRR